MNFIYFMPDEMRAESLRCYGHPTVRTPNMDALAAQGTRFDQCHVQHPACSPSRCSLLTGWYPHVNGHRTLQHLLRRHEPHLFKYLHQAGYDIRWFGKNDTLAPDSFDCVTEARSYGRPAHGPNSFAFGAPGYDSFLFEPYEGPLEAHRDVANIRAAISFLRSKPQKPFLLFLPLSAPHPPYSAPAQWHSLYEPESLPELRPAGLANQPAYVERIRATRRLDQVDPAVLRKIQAVYLGSITFVDHLLGELLDALTDSGLDDDTAVFQFSDHGDFAGDYGLVEKWWNAHNDIITRVPLIARIPDGKQGHVVHEQVELFDVMATTMELAGLSCRHTHFARSLMPQIRGEMGDPNRAVFCEGGFDTHEPHCFEGKDGVPDAHQIYAPKLRLQQEEPQMACRSVMMRTQKYKLVRRTQDRNELYDLSADPRELDNRYYDSGYGAVRVELESRLLEWYLHTSDQVPWDDNPRPLPKGGVGGKNGA